MKILKWKNKFHLNPKHFLFLTLAGIINSIGVTLFLIPVHLYDSGFSGTAYLLTQLTPSYLTLSLYLVVLNFPLFFIGLKKMGLSFIIYSLYAVSVYAVGALIIQKVLPLDWSNGSPIIGRDIVLGAIFGGLLSGIGSGLTIRYGGALDGVEVVSVMIHKKVGVSIGTLMMIYNATLYIVAAFIVHSWEIPLYSVITYFVGQRTVDFVVEGLDHGKAAIIITDFPDAIAERINREMGRGITLWPGYGFYSKKEKNILYVVVNRFEITRLKHIVHGIDPKAFVTISDVTDVMGIDLKMGQSEYNSHK